MRDTVQIDTGRVRGVTALRDDVIVFKGVPYAAPPVGELRWRAPEPCNPWTGVRDAASFANACAQTGRGVGLPSSEDCLYLNIWTPKRAASESRPVLVWIHGGRFIWGAGHEPEFDGTALAQAGLVVVTLNYRLGVFGFLSTLELSAETPHGASGNYGLLDQLEALRWVRRNIAAFGGDSDRVVIAGQSAGAASVMDLVYSPLAAGLFYSAVAESGVRYPHDPAHLFAAPSYRGKDDATWEGERYASERGASSATDLRRLSTEQLLDGNDMNQNGDPHGPPLFRPVLDGWVLPDTYEQVLSTGRHNDVPILMGSNRDEGRTFGISTSPGDYANAAQATYAGYAAEFLDLYPATTVEDVRTQKNEAARDRAHVSKTLWAQAWSQQANSPVFSYLWNHVPPGAEGELRGAYHGSEISYVFNSLYATDLPWTEVDRRAAKSVSSYIVNFASHGDPNGAGLTDWPKATRDELMMMGLGDRCDPFVAIDRDRFDFHKRYLLAQPAW